MNNEYDAALQDKQKLKIDKMFEEITKVILDKKTEVKVFIPKVWTETFQEIISTISFIDIHKKNDLKVGIKNIKFNRKK